MTFADAPQCDLLFVPGGPGVNEAMLDDATIAFLRRQAEGARFVTSVCTGALVLGAAGLLDGYEATTHWASMEFLPAFGAHPVNARFHVDRNRITGGGVTAGIDFALFVVAQLHGEAIAKSIQLAIEYAPAPPFDSGTPDSADAETVAGARQTLAPMLEERRRAVEKAAQRT
jgi:cyclohexyl-isocyanide hydratase